MEAIDSFDFPIRLALVSVPVCEPDVEDHFSQDDIVRACDHRLTDDSGAGEHLDGVFALLLALKEDPWTHSKIDDARPSPAYSNSSRLFCNLANGL
jgi:hypothetical protein